MSQRLDSMREKVIAALDANDGLVMLGGLSALLGVKYSEAVGIVQLLGYEVQDWGGVDYITDDNSSGIIV